jgi:transcriptional regulator with XRE-family HTH domain
MSRIGETISVRIKALRSQRQLSLQELADRAGCTKTHIWELEQGRSRNPTIEMAVSVANALGVSLEYLTGLSSTQPNLHPEAMRIACEVDALIKLGRAQP